MDRKGQRIAGVFGVEGVQGGTRKDAEVRGHVRRRLCAFGWGTNEQGRRWLTRHIQLPEHLPRLFWLTAP
eukprot:10615465-Alexandrium_andersonii.AAC.1